MIYLVETIPVDPGLYWYTLVKGAILRYCRVWRQPEGTRLSGELVTNTDGIVPVKQLTERYWCGPLPEPRNK